MKNKRLIKMIGITLLLIGLALTVFGIYNYITALIQKLAPKYFWCTGLGLPILGFGFGFTLFSSKTQPNKQIDEQVKNNQN